MALSLSPVAVVEPTESYPGDEPTPGSLTVWTEFPHAGVDRPRTSGISVGPRPDLARRLAAAIDAGAIYTDISVKRDVNGASYVQASNLKVRGRALNADLRRLGY